MSFGAFHKYRLTAVMSALVLIGLMVGMQDAAGYESKWVKVDPYARSMMNGSVKSIMDRQKVMFDILYEQPEADYPIFYVDQNATGTQDGSSWENAYHHLHPAIAKAAQSEGWVWVAKGTYRASDQYCDTPLAMVLIKEKVMIFGGFAGHETHIDQRDIEKNVTTIMAGWGDLRAVMMRHQSLIDGFTIRNSGWQSNDNFDPYGDKSSGGGIHSHSFFSIIRNCRIHDNRAYPGGGIMVWGLQSAYRKPPYSPIIDNCMIYNNDAECGAGVHLNTSEVLFTHNVVYGNIVWPDPRGFGSKGIEVVSERSITGRPLLVNCIVWNHSWLSIGYWQDEPGNDGADISNCCIAYQSQGWGDFVVLDDPMFVDPENGDFRLQPESPCIDAGYAWGPPDPDGSKPDIGIRYYINMGQRYNLTVDRNGFSGDVTGAGVYNEGAGVTLSSDSTAVDSTGLSRQVFTGWAGTGDGSYTGDARTVNLTMTNDMMQTVQWKQQHYLDIINIPGQQEREGWYDAGETVALSVPSVIPLDEDIRDEFAAFVLLTSDSNAVTDTTLALEMNRGRQITVNWTRQYRLDILTGTELDDASGWYNACTGEELTVPSVLNVSDNEKKTFASWTIMGTDSNSVADTTCTFDISEPLKLIAYWDSWYTLTCDAGAFGAITITPEAEDGWFEAGETVTLSAVPTDTDYVFIGWSGDVNDTLNPIDIVMDAPRQVNALFVEKAKPVSGIADTTFEEDGMLLIPIETLMLAYPGLVAEAGAFEILNDTKIEAFFDTTQNALCITAEANWSGETEILLNVRDEVAFSYVDTVVVTVTSVPDMPRAFGLIAPDTGLSIPDTTTALTFSWQASENVDPEDAITYTFILAGDSALSSNVIVEKAGLSATELKVTLPANLEGNYYWGVRAADTEGNVQPSDAIRRLTLMQTTGLAMVQPTAFGLSQNVPNPFNPTTLIEFSLPKAAETQLLLYNLQGQLIEVLLDQKLAAGNHQFHWDAAHHAAGTYFYRLVASGRIETRKCVLLK